MNAMQLGLGLSQNSSQIQKISQKQVQNMKMSQNQIQSLNILSYSMEDLRSEIYNFAQENPTVQVEENDFFEEAINSFQKSESNSDYFSDNTKYSTNSDIQKSNDFQKALESNEDFRESLNDHLIHQLNLLPISDEFSQTEKSLCEKLINNLDKNGFYELAPESFCKNPKFLEKCLAIIREFDPIGICCKDVFESFLIQARYLSKEIDVPEAALFILDGHFDFLDPPQVPKITKKINNFIKTQQTLKFSNSDQIIELPDFFTEEQIEEALSFIKNLDPKPTRNFTSSQTNLVSPDIFVERLSDSDAFDENLPFKITIAKENLPNIFISDDYKDSKLKEIKEYLKNAKVFIDSINLRESTLLKAVIEIVKKQIEFFKKGSSFLVPFLQKDLAQILKVDDSTISRLVNQKYLSCSWGIFPLSYFFSTAVNSSSDSDSQSSKSSVKSEIEKILKEHRNDKKQLSDQKISDILLEKGIKIARRTVAKYRSELNINSSFSR